MREYLLSILSAALVIALVGMLAPEGMGSSLNLISSLFLLLAIAAPLPKLIVSLPEQIEAIFQTDGQSGSEEDFRQQSDLALEGASKAYLVQSLTQLLEEEFSIPSGEVRCAVQWAEGEEIVPEKITVILSGSAIWKNPAPIEETVSRLMGCECVTAIEANRKEK